AKGTGRAERAPLERGAHPAVVQGMAELVQRREERAGEVVLTVAGRDPYVGVREARRERVSALVEPEEVSLDREVAEHANRETALRGRWKAAVQTRVVDRVRPFRDRRRQRHDRCFQRADQTLGLNERHAGLEVV